MNKEGFILKLSEVLDYQLDKCRIINDILESNFFISKKNKDKIITELSMSLDIGLEESTKIYEIAVKIINDEIKNKLKHPFKSQD